MSVSTAALIVLMFGAAPATQPTTAPTSQPAKAVNEFCAVMQDEKIDPKVTYLYKKQTVGFCCPDCIDDFKKDPEKYVKNLK